MLNMNRSRLLIWCASRLAVEKSQNAEGREGLVGVVGIIQCPQREGPIRIVKIDNIHVLWFNCTLPAKDACSHGRCASFGLCGLTVLTGSRNPDPLQIIPDPWGNDL